MLDDPSPGEVDSGGDLLSQLLQHAMHPIPAQRPISPVNYAFYKLYPMYSELLWHAMFVILLGHALHGAKVAIAQLQAMEVLPALELEASALAQGK